MCVINGNVSLTMAKYYSDIKIKDLFYSKVTRPSIVTRFGMICAYTTLRNQVSVYSPIDRLVSFFIDHAYIIYSNHNSDNG